MAQLEVVARATNHLRQSDSSRFEAPCRIAAGFYHNLVLENSDGSEEKKDDVADRTGENPGDKEEDRGDGGVGTTIVWGFGTNRNFVLGEINEEEEAHGERAPLCSSEPKRTSHDFFNGRYIAEVSCGGNHSMFLEKRPEQDGGVLWTVGLGNQGRLGFQRPEKKTDYADLLKKSGYTDEQVREHGLASLPDDKTHNKRHLTKIEMAIDKAVYPSWCIFTPIQVQFPNKEKIARVACGCDHTLVLTEHGYVFAWGLGDFGNLGTGTGTDRFVPEQVPLPNNHPCRQVTAGTKHSMVLTREGDIYSWGHGGNGRLGLGESKEAALTPRLVGSSRMEVPLRKMRYIATGEAHSASIDDLGNSYCWGAGSYGRTGHGEDIDIPIPKLMASLTGQPCMQIALGSVHSLALTQKGTIFAWGSGLATGLFFEEETMIQPTPIKIRARPGLEREEKLYEKQGIVEICCGSFHSLALNFSGKLYTWGSGSEGRLGRGLHPSHVLQPHPPDQPYPLAVVEQGSGQIDKGKVPFKRGWSREIGQRGISTDPSGEKIDDKDAKSKISRICCGGMHSGALMDNGDLWVWGSGEYGQTGATRESNLVEGKSTADHKDQKVPKMVHFQSRRILQVAFGLEHCLVIDDKKMVWSWGQGASGQLGHGNTKNLPSPVQVINLEDVKTIAAGEDHSAAVLTCGDLFTWGSAECGKLGYGSSMTRGTQQLPRAVKLDDRLKYISCGSQHTAVVNSQGKMFTFGAGWFGRLGQGDMSNRYEPKQVEEFNYEDDRDSKAPPPVVEVYCAAYHTCIVTEDRGLWMCGRDRTTCSPDHVQRPTSMDQLAPRHQEEKWKVKKVPNGGQGVACFAQHTLVLTTKGEIWSWGENKKGQLGLGTPYKPAVGMPEMLKWADKKPKQELNGIATGIAHAMTLLGNEDVMAWGSKSSGALGTLCKIDGPSAWSPITVDREWSDEEDAITKQMQRVSAENALQAEAEKDTQKEQLSSTDDISEAGSRLNKLQKKLRDEKEEFKIVGLRSLEEELSNTFQKFISIIFKLWDPPLKSADNTLEKPTEKSVIELQDRLDRSVCRNLKYLGLSDAMPDLDKLKIHPDISLRLHHYEELLWVLQQQPCYLARLSGHFTVTAGFNPFGQHSDNFSLPFSVLETVVRSLFAEIEDDRTRHLFMALLRLVVSHEINHPPPGEKKVTLEWLFKSTTSASARLFRVFVVHPFFRSAHMKICDATDKESLICKVEKATFSLHNDDDKDSEVERSEHDQEEALFALEEGDLADYEKIDEGNKEAMQWQRQRLQEHLHELQLFLGVKTVESDDFDKGTGGNKNAFVSFVNKFVKNDIPEDIKALFKYTYELVQDASYMADIKRNIITGHHDDRMDEKADEARRRFRVPILKLFMNCFLGELLTNHENLMNFQLKKDMHARWTDRMLLQFIVYNDSGQTKALDKKVKEMVKKTHFNMNQLGVFFQKAAENDFLASQPLPKNFASYLMEPLDGRSGDKSKVSEGGGRGYMDRIVERILIKAEDLTETKLTVDLYKSHFDLSQHYVSLNTSILLQLSNALFITKGNFLEEKNKNPIKLVDDEEKDRVCQLLEKIQPVMLVDPKAKVKKDEEVEDKILTALKHRLWPKFMLEIAKETDVPHNFLMNHRFLEQPEHRQMCFCKECHAPIPVSLASKATLENIVATGGEKTIISNYQPANGPEVDRGVHPFQQLEELLGDSELYEVFKMKSHSLESLKFDLDDVQKNLNQKNQDKKSPSEFALCNRIENAKKLLVKVKNHMLRQDKFEEFVAEAIEARSNHWHYLDSVRTEGQTIDKKHTEYMKKIDDIAKFLNKAIEASEECAIPTKLREKASDTSIRLKFTPIEKKLKKIKKDKEGFSTDTTDTLPSVTFPMGVLRSMKVISRMNEAVPEMAIRAMYLTFSATENGDWEVQIVHMERKKKRVLRSFWVTTRDINNMQRAGKTAKLPFDEGFVVINAFNLLQLLARISSGGV